MALFLGPILGIDPGSRLTGYGVIVERGSGLQCLAFGVLEAGEEKSLAERLFVIGQGLARIIKEYRPKSIAVEKTFFAKNADSAAKLGHARGVCLYEAARAQVPVYEYAPTEIKLSIAGSGRAGKDQVQALVQAHLGLPSFKTFDMSDALALAIHHLRVLETQRRMKSREILV